MFYLKILALTIAPNIKTKKRIVSHYTLARPLARPPAQYIPQTVKSKAKRQKGKNEILKREKASFHTEKIIQSIAKFYILRLQSCFECV